MKIIQAPDTVLSEKAKPVKKVTTEILDLIEKMKHAMLTASDPEGVGIAAPQVGVSLQIFLMKPEKSDPITTVINPHIELIGELVERKTKNGHDLLEGCLSIKDIWGTTKRFKAVKLSYMDETGQHKEAIFENFAARVVQHEYDHLQGILFPRRVLEQGGKLYKSHKDKDGHDIFDVVQI